MTSPTYTERLARAMTEAQLQANIIEMALALGYLVYYTRDSRGSAPGYPDLTLCRPPRLLFLEAKTERGELRAGRWNAKQTRYYSGQNVWLAALGACPGVGARVVRPRDWLEGRVEEWLR